MTTDFAAQVQALSQNQASVLSGQASASASSPAVSAVTDYPVAFTASGSEYFRIWIVNLLLIIVTLGLYLPWARVRKLKYFYSNTQVGGHALDFHGNPRKMLRGFLLAAVFFIVYSQAFRVSPIAGVVASVAMVVLWPLLYRASMRFRMSHTSWRGLRFGFSGSVKNAFIALGLPLAFILFPLGAVSMMAEAEGASARPNKETAQMIGLAFVGVMVAFYALLPLFFWMLKRYQHGHLHYGQLQTELRLGVGSVYGVSLKTLALFLVVGVLAVLLVSLFAGVGVMAMLAGGGKGGGFGAFVLGLVALAISLVVFNAFIRSYWVVRMHNLVWSRTGNRHMRFLSDLELLPYAGLQLKNYLLLVLTLGLYWPFAVVNTLRMKAQAVTLRTRIGLDDLVGQAQRANADGLGDAAADLYGLDVGL